MSLIRPDFNSVPDELRDLNQWVLWKIITRGGKPTKVPFSVYHKPASSTDEATWSSFECVVMRYDESQYAGIGFVFRNGCGYLGVDLDGCRDPNTGIMADWSLAEVEKANTYTEISPSGTGVKMWVRSSKIVKGVNIKLDHPKMIGCDKKPGIEFYSMGRYFAVTGKVLRGFPNGRG